MGCTFNQTTLHNSITPPLRSLHFVASRLRAARSKVNFGDSPAQAGARPEIIAS
jgi:hypothetical protein